MSDVHQRSVSAAMHEWKLRNNGDWPLPEIVVHRVIAAAQEKHRPGPKRREAIQAGMRDAASGRQDAPAA